VPPHMLPPYPESKRRQFARNLLRHTLRLKRGENLLVETWSDTLPWAKSVVLEARILGARPAMLVEDEPTYWASLALGLKGNTGSVGSHEWAALKASDAYVYFLGPMDTKREESRPRALVSRADSSDHEWFRLVQKFRVRSARFDLGRTSQVWARRYRLDLAKWRGELIEAATVDPRTLQKDGQRIAERLRVGRLATLSHPNGTELTLHLRGRKPQVDDGVIDDADVRAGNVVSVIPSGVTTVAVDETLGDGVLVSNATGVLFAEGRETPLRGGRLTLHHGQLAKYQFAEGGAAFRTALMRAGSRRVRPGLLSVGLNPKISTIPLLFDQERGTVTFEIGRNFHFGGASRVPRFAAYLAVRGASLEVDGESLVRAGRID
jgi:leucyl aminopeptidase (aminopeptidase T)